MFFWAEILGDLSSLRRALSVLASIKISGLAKLLILVTVSFLILEFLVSCVDDLRQSIRKLKEM